MTSTAGAAEPEPQSPLARLLARLLARAVEVEGREIAALIVSFAYFFAVLTAYYIVRPLRDEMGMMLRQVEGPEALHHLLVYVFVVMLAAVPLFGIAVQRTPTRWLVPAVYVFFISNLVAFWVVFGSGGQTPRMAKAFFIWVSIFNLFVISLFWSVMSETWGSGQAKRLYGFIAAGGSIGGMTGPLLAQALVKRIGTDTLLLVSAGFLVLALVLSMKLKHLAPAEAGSRQPERAKDSGILAGALLVFRSRYLMAIAAWVFLANLILTYFYLEQARIVGAAIADREARVELLARVDLFVSLATIALQFVATGRLISRLGLGIATACVPLIAIVGFIALAISPTVPVILAIMIAERAFGFAFANPAARVLWTVADKEEKYKAQSFVDTVVFRGGDAASGWVFGLLGKTLGLGGGAIAFITVPFAVGWLVLSLALSKMHAVRAGEYERGGGK